MWRTLGRIVTPETALQLSAVFACARVLAETMASVPLHWYEKRPDGGRRPADEFYLGKVLQNPNDFMTGFELIELLMKHLALRGNAYCQIEYDERGRISEFWPLLPQNFISWKIEGSRRIYQYMATGWEDQSDLERDPVAPAQPGGRPGRLQPDRADAQGGLAGDERGGVRQPLF